MYASRDAIESARQLSRSFGRSAEFDSKDIDRVVCCECSEKQKSLHNLNIVAVAIGSGKVITNSVFSTFLTLP